jgi:hypothetical protein
MRGLGKLVAKKSLTEGHGLLDLVHESYPAGLEVSTVVSRSAASELFVFIIPALMDV